MSTKHTILVILGPTASGKSDLAVNLAKEFNGEIISADSRQVYKGLDLGTGKITKKEMRNIPHYLLDITNPKKIFNTQDFKVKAQKAIKQITKKNKLPIIAGGTAFYIDTLIYDLDFPSTPANKKLRDKLSKKSTKELFKLLKSKDLDRANNIDPNNPHRLIRALEIIEHTKQPIPKVKKNSPYEVLKIGITKTPAQLKTLITKRLNKRLKNGLIEEVQKLHKKGLSYKRLNNLGIEYRYISMYLKKEITKQEMEEKIIIESYHYAKRQMTWWKKDQNINWIKDNKKALSLTKSFLING